jgi:site-specific DNA-methyltransferase (cytosine-N4-specific)
MGLPWRYAIGCIDDLGLILRAEIIWNKPNGLPESVNDRVRRSHEQWFHFVKSPRYFAAVDEVREPNDQRYAQRRFTAAPLKARGNNDRRDGWSGVLRDEPQITGNPLGKLPGSVWTIPSEPLIVPEWARKKLNLPDHFAAFPTEWPRRIILGWSPEGGVVVDVFGGTGTTAMVARALGRIGVSVDLSHDYSRLAKWRATSNHAAKSISRTNLERQMTL